MGGAERVQQVDEAVSLHELAGGGALHIDQVAKGNLCAIEPPYIHLFGDQRVQAVHGGEFLGHRVGRAVLVRRRADDAKGGLAVLAEHCAQHPARDPRPVGVHAEVQCGMAEDAWRPFDGVDLGDQGCVDQARMLE